jgi:hypothetical protein
VNGRSSEKTATIGARDACLASSARALGAQIKPIEMVAAVRTRIGNMTFNPLEFEIENSADADGDC